METTKITDGGGCRANVYARAIIASAQAYGDDPVTACIGTARSDRRSLAAAAAALSGALGLPLIRVTEAMGLHYPTAKVARSQKRGQFNRAEAAAARAIQYAHWRPEAAESQAAPVLDDLTPPVAPAADASIAPVEPEPPREVPAHIATGPVYRREAKPPPPVPAARRFDFHAPPIIADSVEARILKLLGDGEQTTRSMATILDVKERVICDTLRILEHQRRVSAGELPPGGLREQRWRLDVAA